MIKNKKALHGPDRYATAYGLLAGSIGIHNKPIMQTSDKAFRKYITDLLKEIEQELSQ